MARYGPTEPDPASDWEVSGGKTGIEESMWQLGLGESYPERPGEPDCIYYLRTGFCGYGDRCRFNHAPHPMAVFGGGRISGGDYPKRAGQPVCQYYMRTGTCKFGSTCKYHHPRQGGGSASPFPLNFYGFPLRPGEKECTYYMKTGQCKYGMTCKFNHPQPANVHSTPTPAPQQYGVATGNWPVARPPMVQGSYIQGPYGPMLLSPGIVPFSGWAPYPAPFPVTTTTTQVGVGAGQLNGITLLSPSAPAYSGPYAAISSSIGLSSSVPKELLFPQRPGQPECQHYLKTGECKFGSSCKYNHPAQWVVPETSSTLSPMGLPSRPGTPTCTYYAQYGVCKFGPTCKFDHPMGTLSYSPSTSSLSDMPVAPYPVGSSLGNLAPSSSSSDLRAEVISGSNKDHPPNLSSSMTTSTGSILSNSGPISQTVVQQPTIDNA